jgi:rubrerythrin
VGEEHDCPHPVDFVFDDKTGEELTVWICKECGMIWEAIYTIYWAPAEDEKGNLLRLKE